MKIFRNTVVITVLFCSICIPMNGVYAAVGAPEPEWNEDSSLDIHWYDFSGNNSNSRIQKANAGANYYIITMTTDDGAAGTIAGIVNGEGEVVLEPDLYDISSVSFYPDDFSMTTARKGDICYLISGDRIVKADISAYEEMGTFFNGYATVTLKSNAQYGVIDTNGDLLFTSENYQRYQHLGGGVFAASTDTVQSLRTAGYLLDSSGALLNPNYYDAIDIAYEGMIRVSRDGNWGFVDLSGREVVPAIYDKAGFYWADAAPMQKGDKWGLIDKKGEEILAPAFDAMYPLVDTLYGVSLDDRFGVIDNAGSTRLPLDYDGIHIAGEGSHTAIAATKGIEAFLMDLGGGVILSGDYAYISVNPDGTVNLAKGVNGLTVSARLDQEGNNITGYKDFSLYYLSDGLSLGRRYDSPPGMTGAPPHDYGQRFALFDAQGNNLTGFNYENTGGFVHDYLVVNRFYYGSAGLLNRNGAEVLPTIFDDIILTDEGYAFLQLSGSDNGSDTRVGYFKIPDRFSDKERIPPITVYLNGIELYFDAEPVIMDNRTMVPMRKIFEVLGADVAWNGDEGKVTADKGGAGIELTIGSDTAFINGDAKRLDAPAVILNDRAYVPLRFVSEAFNCDVNWNEANKRVTITPAD